MENLKKHLLSSNESKILAELYDSSNYEEINRGRPANKPDSKIYKIELGVLKEYMDLIEQEMEKQGISNKGVSVTLGKYPDKSDDPRINQIYLGYQTIFFSAVDLDKKYSSDKNLNTEENNAAAGTEGIPNLNFMHITPPY